MKEEFKIVSRYDSEKILYKSSYYHDFKGNSWNDFILFLIKKGSDLSYSDLSNSNLRGSNLRGSNLSNSDLSNSDLSNSNLRGSNLRGSNLSNSNIAIFCKWCVTYYKNDKNKIIVKIGCKENNIKGWDFFFSNKCTEKFETERNTIEFLRIKAEYKSVRAYIKEMGENLYNFNKNMEG